jgi:AraC-like DNA-binding protein/multisubunit Na+/H+ antiporter MnhC subunit
MRKSRTYILTAIFITFAITAIAAPAFHTPFYDRWTNLSSKTLMEKAVKFIAANKTDSALVCYTIISNRYYEQKQNQTEIEHSANAMNDAGYMYFFYYFDYQKAYSYFLQSLNVAEQYKLPEVKPYVYLNLANLYRSSSEMHQTSDFNDTIMNYYKKAFYSSLENKDWKCYSVIFYGLAYYAYKTGKCAEIQKEINAFQRSQVPASMKMLRFDRFFCAAIKCNEAKDYKGTLHNFDLMLNNIDAAYTPERYAIMTLESKSLLLTQLNRNDEAIACLRQAERLALAHNSRDLQVDIYRNLFNYYRQKGDNENTAKYQLVYLQKKDSLLNFSKLQTVGEMHFLEQLNKVNDTVKNLSQQRLIQRIIICVILVVTIIIALFLILLIRNYRRLRSDHEQLYRKNVETLKREEDEKNRIETYERRLAELSQTQNGIQPQKTRHATSAVTEEDKETMRQRIDKVLEDTDEICSPSFSLNSLAEKLNVKYWNISHAINDVYGKNFNALLNEYRIKEACRRLNDIEKYGNYTIEAISLGVGFKSRSNFVTTFKSITGLTPSEYLSMAKRSK